MADDNKEAQQAQFREKTVLRDTALVVYCNTFQVTKITYELCRTVKIYTSSVVQRKAIVILLSYKPEMFTRQSILCKVWTHTSGFKNKVLETKATTIKVLSNFRKFKFSAPIFGRGAMPVPGGLEL